MSGCERYRRWMDDAVDGVLRLEATDQLDAHLASCPHCRHQMDDLRSLVSAAAELPGELDPCRDLWPDIERRLEGAPAPRRLAHRMVLAVAALVIVGVGLSLLRAHMTVPQGPAAVVGEVVQANSRTAPLDSARLEYRQARTELLEVMRARRGEVSPETLEVIESNLALIDRAIDDIERVLVANPGEGRLDRHLLLAYARQIELLRWATRMPSRT